MSYDIDPVENPFDEGQGGSSGYVPPSLPPRGRGYEPSMSVEELYRREQELLRREKELEERIADLESGVSSKRGRKANWPPCQPVIYHNIAEDIPALHAARIVRTAYFVWYSIFIVLVWNLVALGAAVHEDGDRFSDVIQSIVYLLALPPLLFANYRFLYQGARKSRKAMYFIYWVFQWFFMLAFAFFAVGMKGSGAAGVWTARDMFEEDSNVAGAFAIVQTIFWVATIVAYFIIFVLTFKIWNDKAGLRPSKAEARGESG
ncbi:hypothetical protein QOT17_025269 [Balamuthia mandrillaris]